MKAVRYHGPGQPFRLEEVDRREPEAGEVLVRVAASGMCHTELHFKSGLLDLGVAPITMGHEVVGRIEELGEGVSSERVGERVIVYYYLGCLECAYCRVGDEHLCPNLRAESRVGEWVVVYGVGGVGFGLIQLARAMGARTIAVGRSATKLDKALELGAEVAVNASEEAVAERIRGITGGVGADVVYECVGTEESMREASAALGRRGRLIFVGYSPDSFTVHPIQLVVFEQTVMGAVGATLNDLYEAVDLVERGVVHTVIDRTLPLERFESGLNALERGELVGRAVLVPGR